MEYRIDCGKWGSVVAIPAVVIDEYIKLASGAALKVLLFLLRHSDEAIDSPRIAEALNITEESAEDCIAFWEQLGILSPADSMVKNPAIIRKAAVATPKQPVPAPANLNLSVASASPTKYSPDKLKPAEIAQRVESSEELGYLSGAVQSSFGRDLNYSQMNVLVWMFDTLGLPAEVILTLCEYCGQTGKTSARYIETLANDWCGKEIHSLDAANAEVKRLTESSDYIGMIKRILKIDYSPSTSQREIIAQWREAEITTELIEAAYDRCVEAIGKVQLKYMDKIIANWKQSGITTAAEARNEKSERRQAPKSEHSYDINEFESLAIGAPKK